MDEGPSGLSGIYPGSFLDLWSLKRKRRVSTTQVDRKLIVTSCRVPFSFLSHFLEGFNNRSLSGIVHRELSRRFYTSYDTMHSGPKPGVSSRWTFWVRVYLPGIFSIRGRFILAQSWFVVKSITTFRLWSETRTFFPTRREYTYIQTTLKRDAK